MRDMERQGWRRAKILLGNAKIHKIYFIVDITET
jgi:hypothetical protein